MNVNNHPEISEQNKRKDGKDHTIGQHAGVFLQLRSKLQSYLISCHIEKR